ncbi:TetR/AcrR family transcriptional regulator [Paenibacillus caui]|uniref:TetR/AcrR family transcriptional regulator n=1 Tax=Paenibacillus caui TaxID=2873927 RepID=UPI001CA9F4EC|nr:TetR/AcrR family transcriptional regulator [Paenibacillus caui]
MPRTVKDPQQRKQEILQAAEQLFLSNGYEKTTVEDILRKVGLSKGGFYHHFQSKEDVLLGLIDLMMDQVIREVEPIVANQGLNAITKLELFFQKHVEFKKPKVKLLAYFSEQKLSHSQQLSRKGTFWKNYKPHILAIVNQGIDEGSMRVASPEQTVELLLVVFSYIKDRLPQVLDDTEAFRKYVSAVEEMTERTLGLDNIHLHLLRLVDRKNVDE